MIFACELCNGALDPASHFIVLSLIIAMCLRGWSMLMHIFRWTKKPCAHPRLQSEKWLANDTPMVTSWCPDCGWRDEGHVHADATTWLETPPQTEPSS